MTPVTAHAVTFEGFRARDTPLSHDGFASPLATSRTQWVAERSSDVNDASATRHYIAQHESVLYCLAGKGAGSWWTRVKGARQQHVPSSAHTDASTAAAAARHFSLPLPAAAAELHLEGGQKLVIEAGQSWMVPAACTHTYRVLSEEPFRALEASPLKS